MPRRHRPWVAVLVGLAFDSVSQGSVSLMWFFRRCVLAFDSMSQGSVSLMCSSRRGGRVLAKKCMFDASMHCLLSGSSFCLGEAGQRIPGVYLSVVPPKGLSS